MTDWPHQVPHPHPHHLSHTYLWKISGALIEEGEQGIPPLSIPKPCDSILELGTIFTQLIASIPKMALTQSHTA